MNDAHPLTTKAVPSFARSCVILAFGMSVTGAVCAGFGYSQSGNWGVCAAGIASLVCFVAGAMGLLFTRLFQGKTAVHGLLGGILVRTGLPLATGILLQQSSGTLAKAGVFGMIVACYLVMLILETLLSVRMVKPTHARSVRGG